MPPVDFGRTAADYARHRAGFPDRLFDRLAAAGIGLPGQRILDLGAGTGALARAFAARGCDVTALDPSPPLLAALRELSDRDGLSIQTLQGRAEATGLPDGAFDVVTAGQCWHWFDGPAAATEARRLLTPGGRLVIAHFDWLPLPGSVVAATEALITAHNPAWAMGGGTGIYPQWTVHAAGAGFTGLETASFDVAVEYATLTWMGRIRASAGVGGTLSPEEVAAFDAAHAAMLAADFAGPSVVAPHRTWWLTGVRP